MDTEDMRELPEDARTALGNYIQAAPEPDAPEPDALQRALLTPRYPDAPEGSPRARLDALRAQAAEHFRADMELWEFEIITRDFMDSIPRGVPDRIVLGIEVQNEVGNWRRRGPPVDWQKRAGALEAELRSANLAVDLAEQGLRTYFWIAVGQAVAIVAGAVTAAVLLG